MTQSSTTDQPWTGGLTVPFFPPSVPELASAAIVVAQPFDAEAGVAVSYSRGIFTRQEWTTGHPVPLLISVLQRPEVEQIRDQVRDQLATRGEGLDDLPLRAFLTVADLYLSPEPSGRYVSAGFGAITASATGQLSGTVSYPDGVTGTITGSDTGVAGESHLAPLPPGPLTPLRTGDLRSLILSLEKALTAGDLDPRWQQMLAFAQQVVG
ncbi:MAG TPA: hypothetical protein VN847_02030 [Streptosporangiaceae bacterium]|nr:hypothetical protein [Streptosporangiaceae bacterium]